MSEALVNVSYCQSHRKHGTPDLPGQLHAEWLEQCVNHLLDSGLPVIVSATCWPGLCNVEMSPASVERRVLWRVFNKVRFLTMPDAGHQVGAAWNVRQGVEFALENGYRHMVHTAEDIVVTHEIVREVIDLLRGGFDYVGSDWSPGRQELNTQFFGCAVDALRGFNPSSQFRDNMLECCLYDLLAGAKKYLWPRNRPLYFHTHDYGDWSEALRKVQCGCG